MRLVIVVFMALMCDSATVVAMNSLNVVDEGCFSGHSFVLTASRASVRHGLFFSIATVLGHERPEIFEALCKRDGGRRVQELLGEGVAVDCVDAYGMQPIHRAAQIGCVRMLEILLDAGAGVEALDVQSEARPLHYAVRGWRPWTAARLLEAGAVVDAEDKFGTTPLLLAVYSGQYFMTQMLLEESAGPRWRDQHENLLFAYARAQPDPRMRRMVRRTIRGDHLRGGFRCDTSSESASDCSEYDESTATCSRASSGSPLVMQVPTDYLLTTPTPMLRRAATR